MTPMIQGKTVIYENLQYEAETEERAQECLRQLLNVIAQQENRFHEQVQKWMRECWRFTSLSAFTFMLFAAPAYAKQPWYTSKPAIYGGAGVAVGAIAGAIMADQLRDRTKPAGERVIIVPIYPQQQGAPVYQVEHVPVYQAEPTRQVPPGWQPWWGRP